MKSTIKDVAKMANVSISTVSRVMNNPDIVTRDKRDKILEAIERLNYTPNALARGLIHKRTQTLGVLIPDISNLFYAELIKGMEDAAHESGNNLIICNTDNNQDRRQSSLKVLSEKQIDGIIFTSEPIFPDSYEVFKQLGVPIVLAATHSLEYNIPSVKVNDEQAAFDAAEYLIHKGHHRIGMISGSMLDPISGLPRIQGFLRALRTHGIDLDPERCIEYGNYHFNDGYEAVRRLHKKFPEMTALFATSDERALGCISYFHEHKIKVPDEISVIGFDNTRIAGMCFPKLTTVAQPLYEMGELAVRKLDRLINGESLEELRTYMAHWIVERETVRDLTQ
ncbi:MULTISPECIES: LacI family DNA-binding transcriptional regulator [unclassified Paenibacillus]|uniref:LacI family DNA-binding transcriptional regulator n=1 Tax=unclassified Paenibacillus TaxID=185978 RepID=UPI00070A24F6|nr:MULTISPECIES: LacI family DNA-binding transcriptional regulator [unclassified Paenibacillus]KQX48895.1 catabolite control protein A [Paenibacillus sp. Root444D2]KRE36515.1 catabolite control protein A [Paenibacillus sp. Soil724D2]